MSDIVHVETVIAALGITQGMRIADFGAGSGHISFLMAQAAGEKGVVTAIDILDDKLEAIRAQASALGLANVRALKANLELPNGTGLEPQSQDIVVAANVLFQNEHKEAIIQEARRVLVNGGILLVMDWEKGKGGFGPPDEYRESRELVKAMVEKVGFTMTQEIPSGSFHYCYLFRKIS